MSKDLGSVVADIEDYLPQGTPPTGQTSGNKSDVPNTSRPRRWLIAASAAGMVTATAAWLLLPSTHLDANPSATASVDAERHAEIGSFAELFVASYLTQAGEPGSLDDFLSADPAVLSMRAAVRYVTRTATLGVRRVGPGYWDVDVAADVLEYTGSFEAAGLYFYQVGIVDDGGRLVASSLPARMPGPVPSRGTPRNLQDVAEVSDSRLTALAGDFVEALLTGRRPIEPYTAAAADIYAITPPPFAAVEIAAVGQFTNQTLFVTVIATTHTGSVESLQYTLATTSSGADPLVAAVLPGPPQLGEKS